MTICLTLIWGKSTILIDAGMPRHFKAIRQGMEEYGGPFETLKAVILTHHDVDQVPKMFIDAGHEIKIYANWSGFLILRGIRVIFTPGLSGHINLWSVRKACFSFSTSFSAV
ncbi:MBL fold metallo-hydrolase [Bacillus sp. SN1]|uniref:MBL fold metallo-hydrolase n=1 Tax=Bacillus sp. SN1 TaxID=2055158 RepID=UPI001157AFBB|nr:MBL fold metallo-hydrolase [Bacillus sp. SN1]